MIFSFLIFYTIYLPSDYTKKLNKNSTLSDSLKWFMAYYRHDSLPQIHPIFWLWSILLTNQQQKFKI